MGAWQAAVKAAGEHVDQVARWEQFKAAHPDAGYTHSAPWWTGSLPVCGTRREVRCDDLRKMIDALGRLAAISAEAAAIEDDYKGWHVWLSDGWRWYATRTGSDAAGWDPARRRGAQAMTVNAGDATGLRAALAALGA